MIILIPNNFKKERIYIVDVLLGEFLGIDYKIKFHNENNYKLLPESKHEIIIKDGFWSKLDEKKGYLNKQNIPDSITFAENNFITEKNIPIIYGSPKCKVENKRILTEIDIFASSFFMLTRWEETVVFPKDKHNRFKCELSLAQKQNFSHRPVVNEYVEMLWNMLLYAGCKQKRKERKFEIIPTHDIDFLYLFNSWFSALKAIGGDLIKRKSIKLALRTIQNFYSFKRGKKKDPYDTFDFFMDISEQNNVKSHFYFIAGEKKEKDVRYNFMRNETKTIIDKIRQRGHIVGIHGGYNSYNNFEQFKKEIERFKKFNIEVNEGRQHYLRFENPKTWQIWNNLGMKYDSTIGYTNGSGFRSGTCYEYHVFDILDRKKLNLIERPLIFMETTSRAKFHNDQDFKNHLFELRNTTEKYNGQFVFLWHNSNLYGSLFGNLVDFYPQIFQR